VRIRDSGRFEERVMPFIWPSWNNMESLLSFDSGFDGFPGVARLS
jgi:hypothetical protein